MSKPGTEEVSRFNRHFAIECNNEFWTLSEELNTTEKQRLLSLAFSSLYHWTEAGTEENIQLANLAVARALCINNSSLCVTFAQTSFSHFDGHGEVWIQAFTNAVLSHALLITGDKAQAITHYTKALNLQSELSAGDRGVFDSTFNIIPDPREPG